MTELFGNDTSSFIINGPTSQIPTPAATQSRRTKKVVVNPELDQIPLQEPTPGVEKEEPLFLPDDDPPAPPHEEVPVIAQETPEEPAPSGPPSGVTSPRTVTSDEEENRSRDNTRKPSLKRKASASPLRSPSPMPAEVVDPPPSVPPQKDAATSIPPKSHSGPLQMVLSTAGASWALQKGQHGVLKTGMKGAISKPPLGSGSALKGMRSILNQFKRGDSGVAKVAESEDEEIEDDDEEMVVDEKVDELKELANDDDTAMDVDVDQGRPAPWVRTLTLGPPAATATKVVEKIDVNQLVEVQNDLQQESSDQPNSGLTVPEPHPSNGRTADECSPIKVSADREAIEIASDDEVVRSFVVSTTTVRFDLASVEASWKAAAASHGTPATSASDHHTNSIPAVRPAGLTSNADEAEAALSRVVSKDDFGRMDVLGQFNRAFMITRLCKPAEGHDDLFIVDQHAADEKYNFERLQVETRIESQKLIK